MCVVGNKGGRMTSKVLKVIICICILFGICILPIYNNKVKELRNEEYKHRMQWWLEYINWDNKSRFEIDLKKQVVVALIDSGVYRDHDDIISRNVSELDLTLGSRFDVQDYENTDYEHGTAMAGIIMARPYRKEGVLGINPEVQLLSIDISSDISQGKMEHLIYAINYAIKNEVDVINISAILEEDNEELHDVIKKAYEQNITIVASSGNDNTKKIYYPAGYEEVISVNSVDKRGNIIYSNKDYDVLAPGKNIVTIYASEESELLYTSIDGTSASAAIISGIVSLIYQYNPNIKNEEIYEYFRSNKVNKINVVEIINDLCNE